MSKRITCKHENCRVIQKEETYPVLGENTTIVANVKVCEDCGEEILDFELDEENLRRAYKKYKKNHALMTAEEISNLRKKYGISQRTLAALIGCSQATVVRYESGSIQNNTHNSIMHMLLKPENMAEILEMKEDELSKKEITTIRNALAHMDTPEVKLSGMLDNFSDYLYIKADQFSGFKEFDYYKYVEMIRYFAGKVRGNLYKTKLFKLLWYADMYFFREYTKSMSGMNYVHYPYGPVPKNYSLILGLMEKTGAINISSVDNPHGSGEVIKANVNYETERALSDEEYEILEEVIKKFGSLSAETISKKSHEEKGYMDTHDMELISYTYAMEME
jgi:putative zinc finger/helix-turn-helix YgiT family protein